MANGNTIENTIGKKDLMLLNEVHRYIREERLFDDDDCVDIKPIAAKLSLDIDKIMLNLIEICKTKNYNVGGHMYCTKYNVIPLYKRTGSLRLDRDHVEGLLCILLVDMGFMEDY